jgi:hypothetical protein
MTKFTSFLDVEKAAPETNNDDILVPDTLKIIKKRQENICFRENHPFRSERPFGSKKYPKVLENEPKMELKMVKKPRNIVNKTMPKFTLIFDRLLVDFGLQIGSPGAFHEPPFLDPKT